MFKPIVIVISGNELYLDYSKALITSILVNSSSPSGVIFYLFTREQNAKIINELQAITSRYGSIIHELVLPSALYRELPAKDYKSLDAYSRLFAPRLLGRDYDRIIYLDIDMIVSSDIQELWDIDLHGHTLGAVRDIDYEKGEGISPLFNSGLLLIDTKKWHDKAIEEQVLQQIRYSEGGKVPLADQDDLNVVLKNDWFALSPLWNAMCRSIYIGEIHYRDAHILHFNGGTIHKPDHYLCVNPGKVDYFHYLSLASVPPHRVYYLPVLVSRLFLFLQNLRNRFFKIQ